MTDVKNDIKFDQKAFGQLTPREIEIVAAASTGLSCKMTAERIGTTESTVQVHRYNIIRKLECGNIAGAVGMLIRGGVIA